MRIATLVLCATLLVLPTVAWAGGGLSLVQYSSAHDYNCGVVTAGEIWTLELGVFDPVNPDFGPTGIVQAVANVGGFRCRLDPEEGIYILGVDLVTPGLDAGRDGDLVITFDAPVPVVPGKTTLATVDVYFGGATSFELPDEHVTQCYLSHNTGIGVSSPTGFGGVALVIDADDPVGGLVPVGVAEGRDYDFLLLQDPSVPVAANSWGALKALYR